MGKRNLPLNPSIPIHKSPEIHTIQHNVGRLIVKKWLESGTLNPTKVQMMKSMNLIIVGPTYLALVKQTKDDLNAFKKDAIPRLALSQYTLVNSSSLNKHKEEFFKSLQDDEDVLHIIVHDEAHFGIRNEGEINKFFQELKTELEKVVDQKKRREVGILLVSATLDVIVKPISSFHDDTQRVSWNDLRKNDAHFAAPEYRSIHELNYFIDAELQHVSRMGVASQFVANQYIIAAKDLHDGISIRETESYKILNEVINFKDPIMVVIRLCNQKYT